MEAEGCSQQWKMHLPEFKHSTPSSSLTTHDQRGGSNKSVTMAPTSRYLTDRQYLTRKPLFTAEQHTSILKKSPPQQLREEKQFGESKEEDKKNSGSNFLSRGREDVSPESVFRLSHADTSPRSASREDLDSPMGVSELRSRLFHEEPSFRSSLSGSRSTQRTFTSSILEVQRLNPPLRPRLTSTVLHPTYTPLSGKSRGDQTQLRLGRGESRVCGETKPCSSGGHLKGRTVSPHQANYWACAIPKSLPPSPDRHSAGWDPNREYQALLDYTYPLRPGQVVGEWGTSELQGDSLLQTDPNLQDSGIDLDHLCSSSSLRGSGTLGEDQRSPDLQGSTRSLDGLPSGARFSLTDPVGLALDSPDCGQNPGGNNLYKKKGQHHQHHALSSSSFFSSADFRRSTSVLPRSRCVCGDLDEEFWPLPEQLEELQQLSRQVRDVTAQLSRPVTSSWESLGPGTTSVLSSIALPERQEAGDKELEGNNQDVDEGPDETDRGERSAAQTAADRSVPEAVRRRTGAYIEPAGGGLSRSSLREVEALVEQLSGLTVSGSQEDQRQRDSLMQHIKVFCSHLEQLIQQLYAVSERMELLAAPSMDIDSVKSSLAEYQSVQREVSSHQPLVSCVLQTGHLLLSCMNATSPLLRDALLMIERQSGALENHTEHFFSSILSAMDSLTQPSPVHQSREEDQGSGGVQGSTE